MRSYGFDYLKLSIKIIAASWKSIFVFLVFVPNSYFPFPKSVGHQVLNRAKVSGGQARWSDMLYDCFLIPSNAPWSTFPLSLRSQHP